MAETIENAQFHQDSILTKEGQPESGAEPSRKPTADITSQDFAVNQTAASEQQVIQKSMSAEP